MDAGDDKSYDDINVTPMVDLYLVLLLIFIIMTTAGVQGMKVDLPKSSSKPADLSGPKSRAITVNNQGKIALDTGPVTLAELEARAGPKSPSGSGGSMTGWIRSCSVMS